MAERIQALERRVEQLTRSSEIMFNTLQNLATHPERSVHEVVSEIMMSGAVEAVEESAGAEDAESNAEAESAESGAEEAESGAEDAESDAGAEDAESNAEDEESDVGAEDAESDAEGSDAESDAGAEDAESDAEGSDEEGSVRDATRIDSDGESWATEETEYFDAEELVPDTPATAEAVRAIGEPRREERDSAEEGAGSAEDAEVEGAADAVGAEEGAEDADDPFDTVVSFCSRRNA